MLLVLSACGQADIELVNTSTPGPTTVEAPPTPPVTPTLDQATSATAGASPTAVVAVATESTEQAGEATSTVSPSSTPEPTEAPPDSPTATATHIPIYTVPATAQPTGRPTGQPTGQPTAAPPPSSTPDSEASVDYFRANVAEADPGDSITLEWATTGADSVTLWRLMATGQLAEFWDVEQSGTFDYAIPKHARNRITFALAVTPGMGELGTSMTTLEIPLRCPDTWFFANPPDICPATAAIVSAGAEQHFQGGLMLWSAAEDRIYVLFAGGQEPEWNAFTDEWDPGEPENDPTLQPPAGFYQPVRGFGQVWREQPGVRDRLGWAIDEEIGYQTAVQRTSYAKYNETYIRAVDGGVWRLEAERSGWGKQ
jgi:hypothetical protein